MGIPKIDKKDFLEKKRELLNHLFTYRMEDLPDLIIFNYKGFKVDLTEEVYQHFI